MSTARRKTTEEPTVRSAAGIRLGRVRMVQTAGAVSANSNPEVARLQESCRWEKAPRLVLPGCNLDSASDGDRAPDWLLDTRPETDLQFLIARERADRRRFVSSPMVLSVFAHACLLAIALIAFPVASEFPAGGETAIPVEMVFVAPDVMDAPATQSGEQPDVAEINIPLPQQIAATVTVPEPEVQIDPPEPAAPVLIKALAVMAEDTEPVPVVPPQEPLPPVPPAPEGILPPKPEPAAVPVSSKPRPAVDQDRVRRDVQAAEEARRQAQITGRRKQQAQRIALDAQHRAAAQGRGEAGTGTAQNTRQARQAGGGTQGAAATAGAAEIVSYRSRVLAHLARYKTYPESAQDAGIQGRSTVSFTITRTGGVTSAALAGSSGASVLDQATLAMVWRAQPFPAMPAGSQASMSFTAVIRYDLR